MQHLPKIGKGTYPVFTREPFWVRDCSMEFRRCEILFTKVECLRSFANTMSNMYIVDEQVWSSLEILGADQENLNESPSVLWQNTIRFGKDRRRKRYKTIRIQVWIQVKKSK